jgi:two-component system, cell cycle sensor histidine kinase and response regulator CckA
MVYSDDSRVDQSGLRGATPTLATRMTLGRFAMTRDQTASSLALMEARLVRAQAIAKIGSWEIDIGTRRLWGSIEAFRIYGLELVPDNALSLAAVQAVSLPQYRSMLDQALNDLIYCGKAYDVEFEICRQNDGAIRHIHSLAELVCDAACRPLFVSGTLHDDTEIVAKDRAMLTALRASEEKARLAFDQAADAIFLGNAAGDFLSVNERAIELTGYLRDELLRGNMRMLFSTLTHQRMPLEYERVHRGDTVIKERMMCRKDGSQVPVEMHTKKLSDGTLQSIMRDLSDRRRLEEQLQLRQRMDSIGSLAGGIAHDFNNILAGIMGYTCLLAESPEKLGAEHTEYVANILHATQRAADLVHSLKSLAYPQPAEADSFDLFEVVTEVVQVLRATTDRVIRKESLVKPHSCLVRGNASNLYHALMNLGVNAVQAIERKGATAEDHVRFGAELCDIGLEHPLGLPAGRYVRITVSDTGVGMSDDVRNHAFEPLFSTGSKGDRKGQGLGLAMVYNIVVRQHGGAVNIETGGGRGCRFQLYLPSADELPLAAPSVAPTAPQGHERILVVEDEPQVARLTRTILERLGYEVLVAADGREAIELFEREQQEIHLVLLDRSLPGLRGDQVFEHLVALRPDLPVVVSSGDAALAHESFPGAFRILQKPYAPALLGSVIREALDERARRAR